MLDIGEKGDDIMRNRIIDSNMPVGKMTRINDFLPPPEKLVILEDTVKVTLSLRKSSVEFFKHQANLNHTKYQKMIRELVDKYATKYSSVV